MGVKLGYLHRSTILRRMPQPRRRTRLDSHPVTWDQVSHRPELALVTATVGHHSLRIWSLLFLLFSMLLTMFVTPVSSLMAAALPASVLETIFDLNTGPVYDPDLRRQVKYALVPYSLVCRTWAAVCRRRLFGILTLRSAQDVQTLFELPPDLRACIVDICLEDKVDSIPWTHRVYLALEYISHSPYFTITHRLDGCFSISEDATPTLRHLYRSLPRQLPMSPVCVPLSISNFHLSSFTDVLCFTNTLPRKSQWWDVEFRNISWAEPTLSIPETLLRHKRRSLCSSIDLRECPERWPFLWLCVTMQPPDKSISTPYVLPEELQIVGDLLRCVVSPAVDGEPRLCAHTHLYRTSLLALMVTNETLLERSTQDPALRSPPTGRRSSASRRPVGSLRRACRRPVLS